MSIGGGCNKFSVLTTLLAVIRITGINWGLDQEIFSSKKIRFQYHNAFSRIGDTARALGIQQTNIERGKRRLMKGKNILIFDKITHHLDIRHLFNEFLSPFKTLKRCPIYIFFSPYTKHSYCDPCHRLCWWRSNPLQVVLQKNMVWGSSYDALLKKFFFLFIAFV